jgi:alpha-L-rhamnosidase
VKSASPPGVRRRLPAILRTGLAGAALCFLIPAIVRGQPVSGPSAPVHPRCESLVDPLGLHTLKPRLSWQVADLRRGAMQSAYHIIVAASPSVPETGPEVAWDSGRVASDRSIQVPYQGAELKPRQRYYWKVRTWDAAGRASPWSAPAWWEMPMAPKEAWKAKPITMPLGRTLAWDPYPEAFAISQAQVISAPTPRCFLRREFLLPEGGAVAQGRLHVASDAAYDVYVNGRKAASAEPAAAGSKPADPKAKSPPPRLEQADAAPMLRPGRNVVAVELKDATSEKQRLIALGAEIRMADGKGLNLVTDAEWRGSGSHAEGWEKPEFDATGWGFAKVGPHVNVKQEGPPPLIRSVRQRRPVQFRAEFDLPAKPVRARAYAGAHGAFTLQINGKPATDHVFAPNRESDRYVTLDVTDVLAAGKNAVAATAGCGWFGGMGGGYGTWPCLLLQLEIDCGGGKSVTVVTDESWRACESPILEETIYYGEKYDARRETPGWDRPGFDDSGWARAVPAPKSWSPSPLDIPPMRHVEVLAPRKIEKLPDGAVQFDFGQNAAGVPRLEVRNAEPGRRVTLRFGETTQPKDASAGNVDVYICKGGPVETWHPRFTYRGFRYARVSDFPGEATERSLAHLVLHTDVPIVGGFECAHPLVSRIWLNSIWSWRSNMHGCFTDCPQRNERAPWNGDVQISAHGACYGLEMSRFLDNFVARYGLAYPGAGWADTVVTCPWLLYQFYDDKEALERHDKALRALMDKRLAKQKDGLCADVGFGDWGRPFGQDSPALQAFIPQAYYVYSADAASRNAALLGKADDARKFREIADKARQVLNDRFLDRETGAYAGGAQTADVLALQFGAVPDGLRPKTLANLVADIEKRGGLLATGFVGTQHLLSVLSEGGRHDVAWRLATQEKMPSWGYMIAQGATTQWEYWPGRGSHNHHQYGCVNQWLMEYLAGIRPAAPGFKKILLAPGPVGGLEWVKAHYDSHHGRVAIHWRHRGGTLEVDCVVPANTAAELRLPTSDPAAVREGAGPADKAAGVKYVKAEAGKAIYELGAGAYKFAAPLPPTGK